MDAAARNIEIITGTVRREISSFFSPPRRLLLLEQRRFICSRTVERGNYISRSRPVTFLRLVPRSDPILLPAYTGTLANRDDPLLLTIHEGEPIVRSRSWRDLL